MKLYYLPGACSLADHIVLEWTGASCETVEVARDKLKSPEYLAISPGGTVPALVEDDGWTLTENEAILHYLAEKHPEADLAGTGIRGRAEVNRWLGFLNSDVHQSFKPLFAPAGFIGDEAQFGDLQQHARENWASCSRASTRNWKTTRGWPASTARSPTRTCSWCCAGHMPRRCRSTTCCRWMPSTAACARTRACARRWPTKASADPRFLQNRR